MLHIVRFLPTLAYDTGLCMSASEALPATTVFVAKMLVQNARPRFGIVF